jgi:pyruvate/2-oxoglutarate dehydrogenase complex dihydrolipoamide dehydrogenase (E3) component
MHARKKDVIAEFAEYRKGQIEDGRFSLFRSQGKFVDAHSVILDNGDLLKAGKILGFDWVGSESSAHPGLVQSKVPDK